MGGEFMRIADHVDIRSWHDVESHISQGRRKRFSPSDSRASARADLEPPPRGQLPYAVPEYRLRGQEAVRLQTSGARRHDVQMVGTEMKEEPDFCSGFSAQSRGKH